MLTAAPMPGLPIGTITFLFTDIEGSTRPWDEQPQGMREALARQEAILRGAIAAHGGYAYKVVGDAFQAAFSTAPDALQAAIDAQRALYAEDWSSTFRNANSTVRVRMALHTGVTEEREGDYAGPLLNRVARLLAAGHGGQVLLTAATAALLAGALPADVTLRDLGEFRLKDLIRPENVYQAVIANLPSDFPALKTLENRPNNLPSQPNPFIGREGQVRYVVSALVRDDVRMVTLLGPGGIGKTRLAFQIAAEMLESFRDGVFVAGLAHVSDPALVLPTTAQAIGLRESGEQPIEHTLREYLRDRQMLLVMDNFEQVVEAAPFVAQLLEQSPQVKALVTSRSALRLSIEHEYPVPPMSLPNLKHLPSSGVLGEYEAVRLFVARAKAAKPGFQLDESNAAPVAEICARLDAIPLAIELAAARIKILPPDALLARLGSTLKLLTGGRRDLPARQQTLRDATQWSYDLLEPEEQALFRRLSVFAGGCSLEAAESVVGSEVPGAGGSRDEVAARDIDVLAGVTSLVDKSLIYQRETAAGEPRFWMLQTIREYATEQLEATEGIDGAGYVRLRHAQFFLQVAEEAEEELKGERQANWLQLLEDELDNMRAALEWSLRGAREGPHDGMGRDDERAQIALRIAAALYRFWETRGYLSEGRRWLELALETVSEGAQDEQDAPKAQRAKALNVAGNLAMDQGDYSDARRFHQESLALRRHLNDLAGIAGSLGNLGNVAWAESNFDEARTLQTESLARRRQVGDKWMISVGLNNLALVAQSQEQYDEAHALLSESLVLRREIGDNLGIADSLLNLADVSYERGDVAEAGSLHKESLILRTELGDKLGIAMDLEGLAGAAAELAGLKQEGPEDLMRAARLLGAAEALRESIGTPLFSDERRRYERYVAAGRSQLDTESWDTAWQEGRAMSMEEAVEYALEAPKASAPAADSPRPIDRF